MLSIAEEVLDALVQTKRNKAAALKLMRKLLKKYLLPEELVTDDLRLTTPPRVISGSTIGTVPADGETTGRRIRINPPEDPNDSFKSVGLAQVSSFHAAVHSTFNVQRHLISARTHRAFRTSAMDTRRAATAAA